MTPRDLQRIIFNLVLGPLIGGVLFFAGAAIYEALVAHTPDILFGNMDPFRAILSLLLFAYIVAAVPALLNGITTAVFSHLVHERGPFLTLCFLSGGLWSGLIIGWVVVTGDTAIAPPPIFITMAAVFGAIGSVVVALLFDRFVPVGREAK